MGLEIKKKGKRNKGNDSEQYEPKDRKNKEEKEKDWQTEEEQEIRPLFCSNLWRVSPVTNSNIYEIWQVPKIYETCEV